MVEPQPAVEGESSQNTQSLFEDSQASEGEVAQPFVPRRSSRIRKAPERLNLSVSTILYTDSDEPECYEEVLQDSFQLKWELAMKEEMKSLHQNKTWELVKLPEGRKTLQNKWVYRLKEEADGSKRFKARLVVKGFGQKKGIDYDEIFLHLWSN